MHGSWLSIRVMDTRHSLTLREDGPDGIIAPAFSLSATGEASDSYSSFLFILTIPAQVSGSRVRCLLKFCLGILACFTLVYFLPGRPFKTWPLRGPEGRFFPCGHHVSLPTSSCTVILDQELPSGDNTSGSGLSVWGLIL